MKLEDSLFISVFSSSHFHIAHLCKFHCGEYSSHWSAEFDIKTIIKDPYRLSIKRINATLVDQEQRIETVEKR